MLDLAFDVVDELLRLFLTAERLTDEESLLLPRGGAVGVLVGLEVPRRG